MKHMFAVFFGAASYGILSTFVVLAYDKGYKLQEVVGTQLLVGFLLLSLLSLAMKWKGKGQQKQAGAAFERLNGKKVAWLMLAGVPQAATGLLYYNALKYIPASLAIILLFQFVWISLVIQAVRQRKWPQAIMLVSLAIVIAGTVLAAGVLEEQVQAVSMTGILFGLLAAVSYTVFILISGGVLPKANPLHRTLWMVAGALLFVSLIFPPHHLINGRLWGDLLLFGLLLGCFGAFIPPLLFAYGVPHIGEGLAGILGAVELPVAVMLSTLVLHEQVSWLKWAGVLLVLVGIIVPEAYRRRKEKLSYQPTGC